jgi:hypothetical protein
MKERNGKDGTHRMVVASFSDLEVEYRFTDAAYAVGDTLLRNGDAWTVATVQEGSLGDGQTMITCQRATIEEALTGPEARGSA